MEINSSQCKDVNYSKKEVRKQSILQKKDTGCEFKNSDIPPTDCNLIEQQRKSYCVVAANDADSVEKIKTSKTHEINANPEKHMSTQNPYNEATFSSY